jgi:hypothetical protein
VRVHRQELVAAGALSRVGRELVVLGARYVRWLERKAVDVGHFDNGCAKTGDSMPPPKACGGMVRGVVTRDSAQPSVPVIDPPARNQK